MLIEEDLEKTLKIIVVGNGQVGKTTMITRFAKGHFLEDYKKTLGVAFLEKNEYVPSISCEVNYHLWDTAGQEEFDALTREYYRGASGCVLAFSVTDKNSFNAVKTWQSKVIAECGKIPMVIVQTKSDLLSVGAGVIASQQAQALAGEMKLELFNVSSKENRNIKEAFHKLATLIETQTPEEKATNGPGPVMKIGEITRKNRTVNNSRAAADSQPREEAQQQSRAQQFEQDDTETHQRRKGGDNNKEKCTVF